MVARGDPGLGAVGFGHVQEVAGLGHGQRLGHGMGQFRRPQRSNRWIVQYILFIQKIIETANGGDRPRRRAPRHAGARRQPRAEIRARQPLQRGAVGAFAPMMAEKQQKGGQVAPVGRHRMVRSPLLVGHLPEPVQQIPGDGGIEGAFQIRAGIRRWRGRRSAGRYPGRFSHARAVLSMTRARNR